MGQVRLWHPLSLWALESGVVIGKVTLNHGEVEGGEDRAWRFPLEEEVEALRDEAFDILALAALRPPGYIRGRDPDQVSGTLAGMVDGDLTSPACAMHFRAHHNHRAKA